MAKRRKVNPNKTFLKEDKVSWKDEFRATHCISKIREIQETYWDDEYKLFKIKQVIELFIKD